jgi:hypothetical protein
MNVSDGWSIAAIVMDGQKYLHIDPNRGLKRQRRTGIRMMLAARAFREQPFGAALSDARRRRSNR